MTKVNCSFTLTFNNDYHHELTIFAPKKKQTAKQQQKNQLYWVSSFAKTIDNGNHNKNNNDNDIDNNNYHNCNNNTTYDRKLI